MEDESCEKAVSGPSWIRRLGMVDVQLSFLQQVIDDGVVVHELAVSIVGEVDVLQYDFLIRALRAQLALGVHIDDCIVAFLVEIQVLGQ